MSWTSNGGSNAAPKTSAVDDTATVSEGGGKVTIDVLANDVATTKTLYSVEQHDNRQSLTDTTAKGATISIVGGKLIYDISTSVQAQALAVGETMTDTFTYIVTLDGGKKDEATVTVTVTGTNDAPILAPDLFGPHKLTEVAGVTGGSAVLSNSGVLLFGDIDVKDTHTVSSTLLSSELSRGTIPVATQQALAGALTTAMQIDSTYLPGGTISYKFALADKAVDFLGAGDTLKLTYNLTVSDGHGGTSTQPVTFIITGTADAVVVTRPPAAPIGEGGVSTVDAFAGVSNIEGYTLTATGLPASLPAGLTYNASTHSFVFDSNNTAYNHLAAGQTQTVTVSYGVSNGTSTVNQTLTWTVTGTNDAPIVAAPVTGAAGAAGGVVSLNALAGATDLDDGATLSVVNVPGTLPAGMTYDAATKTFKLDPANAAYSHLGAGQTQQVTVSYGVSDGTATTPQTATFTVTGVNDAPKVTSAVTAGSSQTGAVQTVDALGGASDVDDGTTLSVTNVPTSLPAGVTYDAATHSFKLDATNPAYAHLPAGATQTVTVSYGVSDGTATTPQTLTWTVTGTNDAPKVAQALTGAAADNGAVSTVDALAGASDADDGATLSVANVPATLPAGVTYDAATHSFKLDPANAAFDHLAAGQTQTVSVTFGVSDGTVTTPQTITWTVTGSNDAPVVASALTGAAADNGAISTINALSGASDVDDGANLSVVGVPSTLPAGVTYDAATKTFSLNGSNAAYDHLAAGQTQTVTVSFGVSDGTVTTPQTVTWTVTGANDAPVVTAALTGAAADGGAVSTVNALAGASDVDDGATLSVANVPTTLPAGVTYDAATHSFSLDGSVAAYDHLAAGQTQTVSVTFGVSDGVTTTPQTVTWTVTGANDAPVVAAALTGAAADNGAVSTINALSGASDVDDGTSLSVVGVPTTLPAGVTYDAATKTFSLNGSNAAYDHLAAGQTQTVSVSFGVSDGTVTTPQTVTWTVTGANDAPVVAAALTGAAADGGAVSTVDALSGASDVDDGATLSVVNVPTTLPAGVTYDAATHSFSLDGSVTAYDHLAAGQTQSVSVTFGVSDGTTTTQQTLTWTVTGANDAPVVAAALTGAAADGGAVSTVSALAGASDVDDGASLSVVGVPPTLPAGVTYDAATKTFSLDGSVSAYDHLAAGQTQTVSVSFGVSDGTATTQQTVTWTVTGANDAPVVAAALTGAAADGGAVSTVDALSGASDVDDGASLSVVVPAVLPAGVTYDANTHSFSLDGSVAAYDHLAAGQTQTVSLSFGVSDGATVTNQTVTWTVTGANDAPVVSAPLVGVAPDDGTVSTIDALAGASDVDDGTHLSILPPPGDLPAGVTFNPATHSFTLDASNGAYEHLALGQTQVVSVQFNITDGLTTTPQTVTWTVVGANDAPVVLGALTGAAADNGAVSTVNALAGATDADDGAVLSVVDVPGSLPAGVTYDASTHSFSLDGSVAAYDHLAAGQTQTVSVTFGVSDGQVTTPQTVTWTVTGANDAPVVAAALTGAAADNGAISTVNALSGASDIDDGALLSVVDVPASLPAGVTYDAGTHSFSLDGSVSAYDHLAAGQTQVVSVTFGITDGAVTTPQTVTWTVTGANDAPVVLVAPPTAAAEGAAPSTIDALAGASDVDNGATLNVVGVPGALPAGVTYDAASHSFTLDASNPAYNHLAAGATQAVSVTFGISDGTVTTPQTVSWTVTGANDAPVVTALTATPVPEGAISTVSAIAGVTDVDDGAVLNVLNVPGGLPPGVTYDAATKAFSLDAGNGAYNHLAQGATQVVSVGYNVSDGTATTAQTVSWTVVGTNDVPVATPVSYASNEGGGIVTAGGVAGVTDVDDGTHYHVVAGGLPPGVTFNPTTLLFSLNPNDPAYNALAAGETQVVTFQYQVVDQFGGAVTQTANWTLTGANDAPVVTAVSGAGTEGSGVVTLDALAGASDIDHGATLSVVNVPGTLPAGVTYNAATHTFTLDPSNAAYGSLSQGQVLPVTITYGVSDGTVTTAATTTFNVSGINDAAVIQTTGAGVDLAGAIVEADRGAAPTASTTPVIPEVEPNNNFTQAQLIDTALMRIAPNTNLYSITVPASSFSGGISATTDDDYYKINLTAGQLLTVDIDTPSGSSLDSYVYLYNSAGQLLLSNDDSATTAGGGGSTKEQDSFVQYSVPTSGTYYIMVKDFDLSGQSSAGAYVMNVSLNDQSLPLTDTGAFTFTDDIQDTHTVAVVATGANSSSYVGAMTAVVANDTVGDGSGQVTWQFSVPASQLQFLSQGETLTQTYNVRLTDSAGDVQVVPLSVVLTGVNDAPVVTTGTTSAASYASGQPTIGGTFNFIDVDHLDLHSVSVQTVDNGGVMSVYVMEDSALSGTGVGTIYWELQNAGASLGRYNITITDAKGGTFTQQVVITGVGGVAPAGSGNETLTATTGADTLTGGLGNDVFVFNVGRANGDHIVDFDGHLSAPGDTLRFVGYGAGATFTQVDATHWQINYGTGLANHEVVTFDNAARINVGDFTFV